MPPALSESFSEVALGALAIFLFGLSALLGGAGYAFFVGARALTRSPPERLEGMILQVQPAHRMLLVLVSNSRGAGRVALSLSPKTRISLNGARASLEQLQVGDTAVVTYWQRGPNKTTLEVNVYKATRCANP